MKYAVIAACAAEYAVAFMCRVLGVAPSGYYAWRACWSIAGTAGNWTG